jgi:NADH pyrophosphatase NudC (nudix superfamily)
MVLAVAVLLALGSIAFTLIVRGKDVPETPAISPTAHLEQRKVQIYENLRDLQFEYRVGKLSDLDYQQTKRDLQKELAGVMAEVDRIKDELKLSPAAPAAKSKPVKRESDPLTCPHCSAHFDKELKFCGECGKPMKAVNV